MALRINKVDIGKVKDFVNNSANFAGLRPRFTKSPANNNIKAGFVIMIGEWRSAAYNFDTNEWIYHDWDFYNWDMKELIDREGDIRADEAIFPSWGYYKSTDFNNGSIYNINGVSKPVRDFVINDIEDLERIPSSAWTHLLNNNPIYKFYSSPAGDRSNYAATYNINNCIIRFFVDTNNDGDSFNLDAIIPLTYSQTGQLSENKITVSSGNANYICTIDKTDTNYMANFTWQYTYDPNDPDLIKVPNRFTSEQDFWDTVNGYCIFKEGTYLILVTPLKVKTIVSR